MNKIPVSVCLLTRDSGKTLARTLESVKDFDDIVISDGGSTDDTLVIARAYGARVISQSAHFHYPDGSIADFSGARNECMDAARYDWCLSLDSDETISEGLHADIRRIGEEAWQPCVCRVPIGILLDGRVIKHSSTYPGYQYRLFNRATGARFVNTVHEHLSFNPQTRIVTIQHPWFIYMKGRKRGVFDPNRKHYVKIEVERGCAYPFRDYLRRIVWGNLRASASIAVKYTYNVLRYGTKDTMPLRYEWARVLRPLMLILRVTACKVRHVGSSAKSQTSSRVKVCVVINGLLVGGAEKLMVDLLERLDRAEFEPSVVTLFQFGHDELYDALPTDVFVYKLRFRSIRDLGAWWTLIRTLRVINPDVVLSNLFFSNTVVRVLAPFFRYRTITVEHNTYTGKTRFERFVDYVLAFVTYRIVAVSKTVASFTALQESIALGKFIIIRNGIDIGRVREEALVSNSEEVRHELGIAPEERVIVNVARIAPQKNHRLLLEGFAVFSRVHPEYRLIIAGGGKALDELSVYAGTLGIGDRVRFLGYRDDIPRLLSIAEFFVSTSSIEGFGIAHAEALACGVPVLTTKTAGPDEMIKEGVNGFFIPAYTKEAIAESLEKMVACDCAPLRAAARASAENYAIEQTVHAYENLFRKATRYTRRHAAH